jgi:hypothetical protein
MKKIYLIAAVALLTFSNCKKKEVIESETTNDTVMEMDSTTMARPMMDSTTVDSMTTK